MRTGRAGVAALATLVLSGALAATASSATAEHGPGGAGRGDAPPVSYHTIHDRDGRVDGVSYDDHDHNRVVCDDDIPGLRVHVFYLAPFLDFGHGRIAIVVDWGDGTRDALPLFPNPHPADPSRPYELVHTYPVGFHTAGIVIHDSWHDFTDRDRDRHEGAPLDVLRFTCPSSSPPPLLPETPVALLLPVSAAVVAGTWYTLRRRRRHVA